jgi:hypothetical protein
MPHNDSSGEGFHRTTRQKGLRNRRRGGRSTYSKLGKGKKAERYNRPYLTGEYREWRSNQHGIIEIPDSIRDN